MPASLLAQFERIEKFYGEIDKVTDISCDKREIVCRGSRGDHCIW